jgi:UPF0716 protein FxsA
VIFVLLFIGLPALEVFVFIEVGEAIGWFWAILLLFGTSLLGVRLLRHQGRVAALNVRTAVAERRPPGKAAINGALGFVGGLLLIVPGFVTDAAGLLLMAPPTRALARRWVTAHYMGRAMRVVVSTGRFVPADRWPRQADVESTAVEDDSGRLER